MDTRKATVVEEPTLIQGDLRAENDIIVHGRIQGTLRLPQHTATVGPSGSVEGDIYARRIRVEGTLKGKLFGQEGVVIAQTAHVEGTILSPRVAVAEGGRVMGKVDTNVSLESTEKASSG